ncbi:hypothetical protein [Streptomyces virginiae]|uniref:ATP-dependent DNA ligase n=1 Tax=Streptomyces virginiae TaxID=1961 RepID=UPI0036F7B09C
MPGPAALRAGVAYEQKLDGHRALLFTSASPGGTVLVQTRRGALVQDRWPDLVAAAETQLPHGLVLDGELVVWDTEAGRLSFEALQRRADPRPRRRQPRRPVAGLLRRLRRLAARRPGAPGAPVRRAARTAGRAVLRALTAPWTLCPSPARLARDRAGRAARRL